jgi:hypothetical protein
VVFEHIPRKKPRLAFIGFGETDEWAHAGRYDLYLGAAHKFDEFVGRLWNLVQSIPQYRNKTTFILSTDHGRGSGLSSWKDHGEKIPESDALWVAVIGPDTRPLGERFETNPITLGQVAATMAALLGKDFPGAFPKAAAPITDVVGY